jgi:hypothetical protein
MFLHIFFSQSFADKTAEFRRNDDNLVVKNEL